MARNSIPSVHEPLKLHSLCVCVSAFFPPGEVVVSALSNGESVAAFCWEWFLESYADTYLSSGGDGSDGPSQEVGGAELKGEMIKLALGQQQREKEERAPLRHI